MDNHYKVLIVGPRHSGKTVFLSSMYYNMSIPSSAKFFLDAENHHQGVNLSDRYRALNAHKKWPEATASDDIINYEFNCLVKTKHGNFQALKVTYYDYSGGRFNGDIDDENEFKNLLQSTDIHLGLIDGARLLQSMEDENYTSEFYLMELERLIVDLNLAQKGSDKIVHFLISKWDLFHGKYTIAEIKDHLYKHKHFKDFLRTTIEFGGKVRLMPVSAVGFDFLDADGKPKAGGALDPYNVDIPLAMALLDPLEKAVEKLIAEVEKAEREANQHVIVDPNLSWWQKVKRGIGEWSDKIYRRFGDVIYARYKIDIGFLHQLSHLKSVGDLEIGAAKLEEENIRANLKVIWENVQDHQSATSYAHQIFLANGYKLEGEHPGSLIDKI